MTRSYDASTAEVLVRTFKEGVLSPLAHDLTIRVNRFSLELDGAKVSAWFDAGSLEVIAPTVLPAVAFRDIEKTIRDVVLKVDRHPRIRFEAGELTDGTVRGELQLTGHTKAVSGTRSGDQVEVRLDQRDFGIKPYTAMLGTLKIKPVVVIQARLTGPAASG